jgi:hypothetical protein
MVSVGGDPAFIMGMLQKVNDVLLQICLRERSLLNFRYVLFPARRIWSVGVRCWWRCRVG